MNNSILSGDEIYCPQVTLDQRPQMLESCPPSPDSTTCWCLITSDIKRDIIKIKVFSV